MNVPKNFEDLLAFFNDRNVKALVVGGYAFCFHARPRNTKDLDFLLALGDFGFGSLPVTIEDLTKPERILQLGYPPERVDLLTSLKAICFTEAWERRAAGNYGRVRVSYLGVEDLIRNKEAVGRLQDLADVEVLRRFTKKPEP